MVYVGDEPEQPTPEELAYEHERQRAKREGRRWYGADDSKRRGRRGKR